MQVQFQDFNTRRLVQPLPLQEFPTTNLEIQCASQTLDMWLQNSTRHRLPLLRPLRVLSPRQSHSPHLDLSNPTPLEFQVVTNFQLSNVQLKVHPMDGMQNSHLRPILTTLPSELPDIPKWLQPDLSQPTNS